MSIDESAVVEILVLESVNALRLTSCRGDASRNIITKSKADSMVLRDEFCHEKSTQRSDTLIDVGKLAKLSLGKNLYLLKHPCYKKNTNTFTIYYSICEPVWTFEGCDRRTSLEFE